MISMLVTLTFQRTERQNRQGMPRNWGMLMAGIVCSAVAGIGQLRGVILYGKGAGGS